MFRPLCIALSLTLSAEALAKVITEPVEYKHGDTVLQGYLAYDDAQTGKRPGVLVIHEWWGCNEYARKRAEQLAGLGYVAFAADMYGKGVTTTDREQAAKLSGQFKSDVKLLRARAQAGLDVLAKCERADAKKLCAIGYCFGGTTALQLALGGADLVGVVSFHGGLFPVDPAEAKACKARLLVLHGADDPFIPADQLQAFEEGCRKGGVDWQLISYGRAVHSFTNPQMKGEIPGAQYNADADRRSWQHMRLFFDECFGK